MNWIISWFRSKNLTAHSIAVAGLFVATLITTDQTVRDFVLKMFHDHPDVGTYIVVLSGIVLKYTRSSSAAGTVAAAKIIIAQPDAPTHAEVEAASTQLK